MPSEIIASVLNDFSNAATIRALAEREAEFSSVTELKLTALALSPVYRVAVERVLDSFWSDESRRETLLASVPEGQREVIIGSGYHAAVYAATRVRLGHPKPLVLERGDRVGGAFAMTAQPTFYLNSRNRPGRGGLAGDRRASLNYLPGAPIQAANVSMSEYQTNADMAFVIRLALAEYADVVTGVTVTGLDGFSFSEPLLTTSLVNLKPARIIDARGLGDPVVVSKPESGILTFPDFMRRMTEAWPLRGVRTVAVLGSGDSARCAVEALVGIGPQSSMTIPMLDRVDRIDWYARGIPGDCSDWRVLERGRYQAIGPSLRADRFGERLINVYDRQAIPVALPGGALIDGRTYDLTIAATGNAEVSLPGLGAGSFDQYYVNDTAVARGSAAYDEVYRVGPHARLGFDSAERQNGVADIPANAVSMFRTGSKTAALAATLA